MSSIISYSQNKREYAIDPQLKILSNFNPPMSEAIAPVASMFMDLMPKKIDKKNIIYESFAAKDHPRLIINPSYIKIVNRNDAGQIAAEASTESHESTPVSQRHQGRIAKIVQ